jgi:hypothetical protein
MPEKSKIQERNQQGKPLTDDCYKSRHKLVQELAYQHWEERGRPLGSPEIDWFAAEGELRGYLLDSGAVLGPGGELYD